MADEIYSIKIEGFDKAAQDVVKLEVELKRLNEERKKAMTVNKGEKELTEQQAAKAAELTKEINKLSQQRQDANRIIKAGTTIANEQAGAYSKLSARLNEARMRYKDLAAAGKENTVEGKKLKAEVQSLDSRLKQIDATTGQHQRSVGDYAGALQSVGVNMNAMNKLIAIQEMLQKRLAIATAESASVMKVLKIALISTGIGAIVVAVGALAAAFMSTQRGVNALNKVLIPITVVFQRLWGIVQELSFGIVDAFKNPQQAVKDLWEVIKSQLMNRLTGFIDQWKAVGKVLQSAFNLDWEGVKQGASEFGEAVIQTVTGVDHFATKVAGAFNKLGEEIKTASDEGKRLAEIKEQLALINIEIKRREGALEREFQSQKEILMDVNKSEAEQLAAGQKALEARRQLTDLKQKELALQIEQAKIEAKQNDTDYEKQAEIAELEAQRDELEAQNIRETLELRNRMNSLVKASTDERIREAEALAANLAIIRDELMKIAIAEEEAMNVEPETDEAFDAYMQKEQERITAEMNMRKAAQDEINKYRTDTVFESLEAEQAHLDDLLRKNLITEKQYAQASKIVQQDKLNAQLELASSIAGQMSELLGKETKLGKLAASAATAINTAQAIMKTIAMYGWTPLGIASMAMTAALGAKQIAQINKAPEKFAEGGIIGGRSHAEGGTTFYGDDGSVFEAEKGELLAIVNKHDTSLLNKLSSINSVHGKKFAEGGIVVPQLPDNISLINQLLAQIHDQRVYVLESDITNKQKHVRVIESAGEY